MLATVLMVWHSNEFGMHVMFPHQAALMGFVTSDTDEKTFVIRQLHRQQNVEIISDDPYLRYVCPTYLCLFYALYFVYNPIQFIFSF